MIAVDAKKKVYFSFNTEIQSVVETFMIKLGYGNTDYYVDLDEPGTIRKLVDRHFSETEVLVLRADRGEDVTYLYIII